MTLWDLHLAGVRCLHQAVLFKRSESNENEWFNIPETDVQLDSDRRFTILMAQNLIIIDSIG